MVVAYASLVSFPSVATGQMAEPCILCPQVRLLWRVAVSCVDHRCSLVAVCPDLCRDLGGLSEVVSELDGDVALDVLGDHYCPRVRRCQGQTLTFLSLWDRLIWFLRRFFSGAAVAAGAVGSVVGDGAVGDGG